MESREGTLLLVFATPIQMVKFNHSGICLIFSCGGLPTQEKHIYDLSLSLSQDSTSITLFSLLQFLLEFYRQNFPLPWDSIDTIPFSSPFFTWCTLRLPWCRPNVLSCGSRTFQGTWSKDPVGDYFCPSLFHQSLVWDPEHNRHSKIALK